MAFWHCIGDAPVGAPPEEGDYWEPDPGPEDGCARLGSVGTGGRWTLEGSGRVASRASVATGVLPGVYELWLVPPTPVECVMEDGAVSACLTYDPRTLAVTGAFVYAFVGRRRSLSVYSEGLSLLMTTDVVEYEADGWKELPLSGSLTLVPDAVYWLAVGAPAGYAGAASVGPVSQAPYSAWLPAEHYEYCDLVAYPVPDTSRHVLPLLKRTALGEGTLIPGGAALCR